MSAFSRLFSLIFFPDAGIIENGSICQRRAWRAGVFWNPRPPRRVQGKEKTKAAHGEGRYRHEYAQQPLRAGGAGPGPRRRDRNSPLPMLVIALATLLVIALAIIIPRCASGGGDESVPAWSPVEATPTQALSAAHRHARAAGHAGRFKPNPRARRRGKTPLRRPRAIPPPRPRPGTAARNGRLRPAAGFAHQREPQRRFLYRRRGARSAPPRPRRTAICPSSPRRRPRRRSSPSPWTTCFQADNLRQIIQCAIDYGGKLTILPIGKNLERESVQEAIRYAYENGPWSWKTTLTPTPPSTA